LKAWKHTRVVQSSLPLKEIACPDFKAFDTCVKSFGDNGFVDNHADWINHSGHAYFWSRIELSEPMKLVFLMGYDGPFRLWLDGKPFFDAVHGANPCLPDEGSKIAALKAGIHQITIGMDTNGGRTWGFFLRFRRLDISSESLRKGTYGKPFYCP
jgi:sialate O-acetylesterase